MKGLRLVLPPFAPDISGATAVFYELGGLIVIIDAGGCAGNVCGFDEPRWFTNKSAIFSAGLRDMDAIFGRDDLLAEKLAKTVDDKTPFIALIGTPVPAVIGTDYRALKRLVERKTHCRAVCVGTAGINSYDSGASAAFLKLFEEFTEAATEKLPGTVGIIGANPLDLSKISVKAEIADELGLPKENVFCYSLGDGLAAVKKASAVEENIVVAPCGLKAAQFLKEKFGVPYRVNYPLAGKVIEENAAIIDGVLNDGANAGKRILIIHQQVFANSLREAMIKKYSGKNFKIAVASFFDMANELKRDGDINLNEEDDLRELGREKFSLIFADDILKPFFADTAFIDVPHFGLSGRLD